MDLDGLVAGLTEFGKAKVITLAYLKGSVPENRLDLVEIAKSSLRVGEYTSPGEWCKKNLVVRTNHRKPYANTFKTSYPDLELLGDFESAYLEAMNQRDPVKSEMYANVNSFVRGCYIAITSQPMKYAQIPS